jgi:hypothetical protein
MKLRGKYSRSVQLPPFCHEALAASVTAPEITYFAIWFEDGGLRRNQCVRACRASRNNMNAGPGPPGSLDF